MKKLALASAVAVVSISVAHAAPTVYGKAFMTVDYLDTSFDDGFKKAYSTADSVKSTNLTSNSSRIGVKGSEPLTANTNVTYQLEYGVDVDSNSNTSFNGAPQSQFYSRNTFLGVANKQYGTVLAGRMDTPFRNVKGDTDVFNAYSNLSLDATAGVLGEYRANNVIAYVSPKMVNLPLTFTGAVSLSENDSALRGKSGYPYNGDYLNQHIDNSLAFTQNLASATASTTAPLAEKKTKDNGFSTSLVYDKNGVYGAIGYDKNVNLEDTAWRIAGQADLGKLNMVQGLTVGAMYQNVNVYDRKDASKSWLVSGKYKVANTPWTVKAQYVSTDNGSNSSATTGTYNGVTTATNLPYLTNVSNGNYLAMPSKIKSVVVGGEYAFNRNTMGVIYAGRVDRDNIADTTIVGTGLEYKF